MTQKYKKKLIEVAIPLEAINIASSAEKTIRQGHPASLHLWWARRPLVTCRAILFAQLVDDPSSNLEDFPTAEAQDKERKRLFEIIESLVQWDNSSKEDVLRQANLEIVKSCSGKPPSIYDPFAGGGAIPLEAQRLGLSAFASDLNPVATIINKSMIEIPARFSNTKPVHNGGVRNAFYRHTEGLAEDVEHYGSVLRNLAFERIGSRYPKIKLPKEYGGGEGTVMAWIWAKTVPSPDPALRGLPVPLVKSFDLSRKKGDRSWVEIVRDSGAYEFAVKSEKLGDHGAAAEGTVGRGGAVCVLTNTAIPLSYIREQGRLGKLGRKLMAIVVEGSGGRIYLSPDASSELSNNTKIAERKSKIDHWQGCTNCVVYGMTHFEDLYTERQFSSLSVLSETIGVVHELIVKDYQKNVSNNLGERFADGGQDAIAYADAVCVYLAFALDKLADLSNVLCSWEPIAQCPRHLFGRQAIPMTWDFAEANIFSKSSGSLHVIVRGISGSLAKMGFPVIGGEGVAFQADASSLKFPSEDSVISMDPPYYDNIPYSNISDFFYFWMKRSLGGIFPDLFGTLQVPKQEELVANQFRQGSKDQAEAFFMEGMKKVFESISQNHRDDYPITIYYAFKQKEISEEGITSKGWASFIEAIIHSGLSINATWPVRTEAANRLRASGSNALATSVVLVCRKRELEAEIISRAEFIRALKRELPQAIEALQAANIAPADMPQSAIGPGIGIFSRYERVLESDDSTLTVKSALQLINQELDEYFGEIQGEFDSETRFSISWYEQHGLNSGDYGTANNIATARGVSVDGVKHAGIVESQAGKVRILKRSELDPEWEPQTDTHLTVWECLQYLVRAHEKDGISYNTALLLRKIDDKAEAVKDLAYCLYDICANKRQDAKEATAYNALIADWSDLTREAAAIVDIRGTGQTRMNF